MPEDANPSNIRVRTNASVTLPSPPAENRYAIRRADWNRLKRLLDEEGIDTYWISTVASICWGMGPSCMATAAAAYWGAEKPGPYLVPIFLSVGICVTAAAVLFSIFTTKLGNEEVRRKQHVRTDIDEIEQCFEQNS